MSHATLEWWPRLPKKLTQTELHAYVTGRNRAVMQLSEELGLTVAVVDL